LAASAASLHTRGQRFNSSAARRSLGHEVFAEAGSRAAGEGHPDNATLEGNEVLIGNSTKDIMPP